MPARGVAVAIDNEDKKNEKNNRWNYRNKKKNNDEQPPLRILLIGDSLAAGVGMSKSGSPVLPESIARALSQDLDGRMVYWTCVGTPGMSTAQIVREIHNLDDNAFIRQPSSRLERLIKEWQAKRNRWQERKDLRRRLSELQHMEEEEEGRERKVPNALKEWWQQMRSEKERPKTPSGIRETTARVFGNWWSQVSSKVKEDLSEIKEDLEDIKDIVRTRQEEGDEENKVNAGDANGVAGRKVAEQYDIAVVLTGLNDIKEAFLPHMGSQSTKRASTNEQHKTGDGVLANHFDGVMEALKHKMQRGEEEGSTAKADGEDGESLSSLSDAKPKLRQPLIVFPELPVAPLQLFQLAPLCWFLIPLFRAMEESKKVLSSRFPDYVLFVHQPGLQWWSDNEAGFGPLQDNLRQERLLFRQTDITQRDKERIQELMREHYNPTGEENPDEHREGGNVMDSGSVDTTSDESRPSDWQRDAITGSSYVAVDKIHPNDEGYELWGRHIAAAIVEHWNRQTYIALFTGLTGYMSTS